jgi:hypothetical protein
MTWQLFAWLCGRAELLEPLAILGESQWRLTLPALPGQPGACAVCVMRCSVRLCVRRVRAMACARRCVRRVRRRRVRRRRVTRVRAFVLCGLCGGGGAGGGGIEGGLMPTDETLEELNLRDVTLCLDMEEAEAEEAATAEEL